MAAGADHPPGRRPRLVQGSRVERGQHLDLAADRTDVLLREPAFRDPRRDRVVRLDDQALDLHSRQTSYVTISDMPLAQIEACKQRRTVQSWVRSGRRRPYGGLPPGILVTEPVHPDVAAWWPPGHALGYVLRSLPI